MKKIGTLVVALVAVAGLSGCNKTAEEAKAAAEDTARKVNVMSLELGTLQDKLLDISTEMAEIRSNVVKATIEELMSVESLAKQAADAIPADAWARDWSDPPAVEPAVTDAAAVETAPAEAAPVADAPVAE